MTEERFYIRFKGRVLGPLPPEKIQEMVRRGQITRQHELSPDGQSWANAEEHERFFAKSLAKYVETTKSTEKEGDRPVRIEWYAHFDGANQGPMDEGTLLKWVDSGKVVKSTMVWKEGMAEWLEAGVLRPEWFAKQSLRSEMTARHNAAHVTDDAESSISALAVAAHKPRSWILFLSITGIVLSFLSIVGQSLLFISAVSSPGSGPIKALSVVTQLFVLIGWCVALVIAVLLLRVASRLQILLYRQTSDEFQSMLRTYSTFWSTLGIFVLIGIIVAFILIFIFLALGVSLASVLGPTT
jgi:hypothetical protein